MGYKPMIYSLFLTPEKLCLGGTFKTFLDVIRRSDKTFLLINLHLHKNLMVYYLLIALFFS